VFPLRNTYDRDLFPGRIPRFFNIDIKNIVIVSCNSSKVFLKLPIATSREITLKFGDNGDKEQIVAMEIYKKKSWKISQSRDRRALDNSVKEIT